MKIKKDSTVSNALSAKIEKFNYYLDLLRKLELVKFTISFNGISQNSHPEKYLVEIDNVRIKDEDDNSVFQTLATKYGRDYYSNI